jgi:hypothetical protein
VNSTAQDEITAYVDGVREALSGLAEPARLELLEDLAEHLAEVQAEGQGTLVERLGTPRSYASEMLAAAGFVGGFPEPAPPLVSQLSELRGQATGFLREADVRTGRVIGYAKMSDFLVMLRPAWWVLRGYLVAMVLAHLLGDNGGNIGLLPRIGGSELVALALLAGSVIVSIVFGSKGLSLSRWPRYALWSGTAVLVIFAISGFVTADNSSRQSPYVDVSNVGGNSYGNVQDVYVYDSEGKLVEGARLFDQDASPIQLGNAWCSDPVTGEVRHTRSMGYPYCPENAPFGPAPAPTLPSTPAESTGPSPSVSPSAPASSGSPSSGSPSPVPSRSK